MYIHCDLMIAQSFGSIVDKCYGPVQADEKNLARVNADSCAYHDQVLCEA